MSQASTAGGSESVAAPLAIRTEGLTKKFGSQTVVNELGLAVPHGAVYGFLGPNGSGKTTTIRMLLGLVKPSGGQCWLLERQIPAESSAALPRIGALVEGPAFHPYLSGRANLARMDAADATADPATAGVRIGTALERVGLAAAAGKKYRAYSLGMKQRLGLAAALLQPRDLLILDEPTNGLDPQGTREIRSLVETLASEGTTVLISSHLLSEVEQMCSHIGVMSRGRLVAQDTVSNLRDRGRPTARLRTHVQDAPQAMTVLKDLGLTEVVVAEEVVATVTADAGEVAPEKIVNALVHAGVSVIAFSVDRPNLEEQFVALTGDGFDVSG